MPSGGRDWFLFSALALWIGYVFWGDAGGFVATVAYSLVIYSGYLTTRWLVNRVAGL